MEEKPTVPTKIMAGTLILSFLICSVLTGTLVLVFDRVLAKKSELIDDSPAKHRMEKIVWMTTKGSQNQANELRDADIELSHEMLENMDKEKAIKDAPRK
ncbi:unnamed protein product [Oikopleura dioica]|uniref:Uncharacterized protein n=1 Tax=Oikopleura dioica TaxID=34765 RepID=E4X0X8_OIKDI|nr:unnamed protein product [Oikopleura dioica]